MFHKLFIGFLLLFESRVFSQTILKNELSDDTLRRDIIRLTIAGLENATNFTVASINIVNALNQYYDPHWVCIMANSIFVSHYESQPNTTLWFTYGGMEVLLFKPALMTQNDILIEAKSSASEITIVESEMSAEMHNHVIGIASIAAKNLASFHRIAKNITDSFDSLYGKYWHCFIGQMYASEALVRYIEGTYISFTIKMMQFMLFQTNQPKYKMNFIDVVSEAKTAEPVVESLPNNTVMSAEVISIANESLFQDFTKQYCYLEYIGGIDSAYRTCYFAISNYIYDRVIAKYGGNWKVAVGEISSWECRWGANRQVFAFRYANLNFNIFHVLE